MKETAFEWHNPDTGHCYVDYVPHNLMDENNGYVKTPLYKHDKITAIIGHDFESIINQEVERRIAERMPVLIKYWSRRRVVDDPDLEELLRLDDLFESIYQANRRIDFGMAADMGMECVIKEIFRSRLVSSQKTECEYYASEGKCLPGCMTDSCKHHPNNR